MGNLTGMWTRVALAVGAIGTTLMFGIFGITPAHSTGDARTAYLTYCASCHGKSGRGDGPRVKSLGTKPHAFDDCSWMSMMSDATIFLTIKGGGAAVGLESDMPAFRNKLSNDKVAALVTYIRRFCTGGLLSLDQSSCPDRIKQPNQRAAEALDRCWLN
jgi:hypothetical protein